MPNIPPPNDQTRIGFHYFPDQDHYRESDLRAWLPELKALGAGWLVLEASAERAIPEAFIRGLVAQHVEPVLHFDLPLDETSKPAETVQNLAMLFESYAHWGVKYAVPFDRPNARASWPAATWAQASLVERFLDHYLPIAEAAFHAGLVPVFPPLEPGGDYWDTAFLREALQAIDRRGYRFLLDKLVLSAIAHPGDRPLNWGAGGPERWPKSRPYCTPEFNEDQRGFRIFDWYLKVAEAITGNYPEIILLQVGCQSTEENTGDGANRTLRKDILRTLTITQAMVPGDLQRKIPFTEPLDPIPSQVLACCFWLLGAGGDPLHASAAWYQADGTTQPYVGALRQFLAGGVDTRGGKNHRAQTKNLRSVGQWPRQATQAGSSPLPGKFETPVEESAEEFGRRGSKALNAHPIKHYLLLPAYEWGIADWHLDVIRPFVKKHQPTVGFSLYEARFAQKVTIVGGAEAFPEEDVAELRAVGCSVERIHGDGTSIATTLSTY